MRETVHVFALRRAPRTQQRYIRSHDFGFTVTATVPLRRSQSIDYVQLVTTVQFSKLARKCDARAYDSYDMDAATTRVIFPGIARSQ